MIVKFLEKEYSIPEDVLTYIDLLSFTDGVQKQLFGTFVRKLKNEIAKDNIGLLGDEDLATEIEQQIGRFIAKLCDNGIFTRTISDYLKNNKGYQLISQANKAALEKMKSLLIREMDDWKAGYENAVNNAESHVTGMGFSIWSSSFVNHAIYAAMEASKLKEQSKEAEAQYQKDMSDLRSRLDSQYGGEKSNYINNTYIPNMETALRVFAYDLLDKYVVDLIAHGKFDGKTLDYIDIGRSNDLLKNLTLSNSKQAILENAFIACPYNVAVYVQAIKYNLMDDESYQTANYFKQFDSIVDEAYKLRSKGNHLEALKLCEGLAELKHARALYCVGNIYWRGLGIQKDCDKARFCFEKAAKQNHAGALNNLGQMYEYGDGVEKNGEKAAELYLAASTANSDISCVASGNLASQYHFGRGLPQNYEMAVKYYNMAIEQGSEDPVIYNNLGVLYMDGKGTTKDWGKALRYLTFSAEKGHQNGKNNLKILKSNIQAQQNAQQPNSSKNQKKQTIIDKLKGFFRR